MKLAINPPVRGCDSQGCGHFGAKRGKRYHRGVDFACVPASGVLSLTSGEVTKIGYPYNPADPRKGHLTYVEVTDPDSMMRFRYFYVNPRVSLFAIVEPGDLVGTVQDLTKVFKGITPHVHLEVIDSAGLYLDPGDLFELGGIAWP